MQAEPRYGTVSLAVASIPQKAQSLRRIKAVRNIKNKCFWREARLSGAQVALNHALVHGRNDKKTGSEGGVMINDINDELILAGRLLLATLFLIFGWRKLKDYSGRGVEREFGARIRRISPARQLKARAAPQS